MRGRLGALLLGSLPVLLAACSDPSGPCGGAFGCEVEGVDLFVAELEILSDPNPLDGRGIIDAGIADISVKIRNRGDETSPSTQLVLRYQSDLGYNKAEPDTVTVPPVAPGRTWETNVQLLTWDAAGLRLAGDGTARSAATLAIIDADTTNNHLLSEFVHVRVGIPDVTITFADSVLHLNRPATVHVRIENRSHYGVIPQGRLRFGLATTYFHFGSRSSFGEVLIDDIAPGAVYESDVSVTVPSYAWHIETRDVIWVTMLGPTAPGPMAWYAPGLHIIENGPVITLVPDHEVCVPATLQLEVRVPTSPVCSNGEYGVYFFRLNADTEHRYAMEHEEDGPGAGLYKLDGTRVADWLPGQWVTFEEAGTYYVVDWYPSPARYDLPVSRSMLLHREPLSN